MINIEGKESVINIFGYWPQFCDGKITKLVFEPRNNLELTIFYIDSEIIKQASITIKFIKITEVELDNLISENVIDDLKIIEEDFFNITIESCCGLMGSFKCEKIEVVNAAST